ncbi:plasmid stability protein [Burkholderia cenocepacia]|uniref:FitA-like ribbon-helix-helix domain-containing protein n=1 Tax=Burkholderia cenocepacia TaxID=95486 RepID=UPI000753CE68|nr:Arc family DNA-binding protein [Burkholderia cenocepacia]KWF27925.1 plasmid stability protein [Burkholderia cenocepacia]MBJ9692104.1 Arc family DNA-binding protein [Burkholderia cenocepacia]MBR8135016.1 Arc family DNA-binding protein [Burkholderia cenocepacia]MBR8430766.1 Arc family DNA-binding protein [Burkholderia cenocepacia]MDF0502791.1 Arc family DNA-binding protein [Burkholderia cenocepacia]
MPVITVRNLPDEVHRALRIRAARHGRSTEAEVRDILEQAVLPGGRLELGTLLAEIGREAGDVDIGVLCDEMPTGPMSFE